MSRICAQEERPVLDIHLEVQYNHYETFAVHRVYRLSDPLHLSAHRSTEWTYRGKPTKRNHFWMRGLCSGGFPTPGTCSVYIIKVLKRKGKASIHAIKAYRWSGVPPILNFGTRWRSAVNYIPRPLYPPSPRQEIIPGTLSRRLGGPQSRFESFTENLVPPSPIQFALLL
jgi:hypothetical protein